MLCNCLIRFLRNAFLIRLLGHSFVCSATSTSNFISPAFITQHKISMKNNNVKSSLATVNSSNDEGETDFSKPTSGSLLVSNMHKIGHVSDATSKLKLLLASQSPRRREILDMMGLAGRYMAEPSPLNEQELQEELSQKKIEPPQYARTLAERKAQAMGAKMMKENNNSGEITLIIGSDTIVDFDGLIMEKPLDGSDAYQMLQKLSGNWHQVHTGVAVYGVGIQGDEDEDNNNKNIRLMFSFTDTARVKFTTLTETDIRSYIESGEPLDKAGSYGIQGVGGQLVEQMEGDFFTVMGLPMHRLSKEISRTISSLGI